MKKIETVIHIHKPLQQVWDVLMDFQSYPEWNPFVKSIEGNVTPGHKLTVIAKLPGKKEVAFSPKVVTAKPQRELRWKGKLLIKGLFDGEHYFILDQLPNGSTALHHGEIFNGILPHLLPGVIENTKRGFQAMNIAMKERCEAVPEPA